MHAHISCIQLETYVSQVPICVRALDLFHSTKLKAAGAAKVITATTEFCIT